MSKEQGISNTKAGNPGNNPKFLVPCRVLVLKK